MGLVKRMHFSQKILRQFGRHNRRWEDNVRTNLRETGYGALDWIRLTQHGPKDLIL
jgi:hypothetical protein